MIFTTECTCPTTSTPSLTSIRSSPRIPQKVHDIAAYTFVHTSGSAVFQRPAAYLSSVLLLVLFRPKPRIPVRSPRRIVLAGLPPTFDARTGTTRWGPELKFWIELPARRFGKSIKRSSRLAKQRIVHLTHALNCAAWRKLQQGKAVARGPVLPPTVLPMPPARKASTTPEAPSEVASSQIDNANQFLKPSPAETGYVRKMAKLYRLPVAEVWPILMKELLIPAARSTVGAPLIDARLWDPASGRCLGEFSWMSNHLGRPINNPARLIKNLRGLPGTQQARAMRQTLPRPLADGCTDEDLLLAASRPSEPLFLSRVCRVGTFLLNPQSEGNITVEFSGGEKTQQLSIPLRRRLKRRQTSLAMAS